MTATMPAAQDDIYGDDPTSRFVAREVEIVEQLLEARHPIERLLQRPPAS